VKADGNTGVMTEARVAEKSEGSECRRDGEWSSFHLGN